VYSKPGAAECRAGHRIYCPHSANYSGQCNGGSAEDYIRTAKAKGLSSQVVLIRHALKNAAVPIITIIGVGIALLIGGVVVTESVFNIPGLGRLTVDAILHRDYPVIQAIIILFAGVYVLVNLLVDLSYVFLDPRIRY
tara:strand:- start:210 stop:623 length:414 start_codon:yes stop_codon:yes gene_type:complete